MRKLIFALFSAVAIANAEASNLNTPMKKVFISQVIEHPALDITTKGIIDGLEKEGFKRGKNLDVRVESAQASVPLASQIASKFIDQDPNIVVGVGTISAQSFVKGASASKLKLVFSSVTDPLAAGLVKSLENPGNNTSGVSNFVDLEPQLKLFQRLQPTLRRLGILYNTGEINSVSIVKRLEVLCPKLGITLVKQSVSKTAEVAQASSNLASSVDAIFVSNDNTVLSALQSVINASNKVKIPVYVSDTDAVNLGALAALGPNQYQVGLQTGTMIARALKGEDVGAMPVEFPERTDLYLNEKASKSTGIEIPEDLKTEASMLIKD